jgi:hypothetical protein
VTPPTPANGRRTFRLTLFICVGVGAALRAQPRETDTGQTYRSVW